MQGREAARGAAEAGLPAVDRSPMAGSTGWHRRRRWGSCRRVDRRRHRNLIRVRVRLRVRLKVRVSVRVRVRVRLRVRFEVTWRERAAVPARPVGARPAPLNERGVVEAPG
eukprot:scaffold34510_cov52-Phaeocystis_antarctica.AAC.5